MDSYQTRLKETQARMLEKRLDYLFIAPSPDLLYLIGFEGHITERLTLLVIPADGKAVFVLPAFEAPRFEAYSDLFNLKTWTETQNPYHVLAEALGQARPFKVAVSDLQWARFLLGFQETLPKASFTASSSVLAPMRERKRPEELELMRNVNQFADDVFAQLISLKMIGLSERQLSRKLSDLLLDAGNDSVGFATVARGPHSASPHHTMTEHIIEEGDMVLFDFGGRYQGYYADVTRTVVAGQPSKEVEDIYHIVQNAQQAAVEAVKPGVTANVVDHAARDLIAQAGYSEQFVHRVGHGVGLEIHEPPYLTSDSNTVLEPGMTFSVEPGIYLPGRFGVRIEDTVLVTETGGERLNHASRDLTVVS